MSTSISVRPRPADPSSRERLGQAERCAAKRSWRCRALAGAVSVAAAMGLSMAAATAQPAPFPAFELLAAGFNPARHIKLRTKGPSDVLQLRVVAQPGDDTGWHTHPGPAIWVVKSGEVTFYHDNGCVTVYAAGASVIELPGEVHRVANAGPVVSELYGTALVPHGAPVLEPAADPGVTECRTHGREK